MCLLALMLASCSSPKPVLTVFKDLQPTGNGEFQLEESNLTIRPQDELMITVTSPVGFGSLQPAVEQSCKTGRTENVTHTDPADLCG